MRVTFNDECWQPQQFDVDRWWDRQTGARIWGLCFLIVGAFALGLMVGVWWL